MPTFNLTTLNEVTPGIPVGSGTYSINVSGTFTGTVVFERAVVPGATFFPIARDKAGNRLEFTAPSGDVVDTGTVAEPDALVRARISASPTGTFVVRIGK
jgi:hypothetical protein